MSNAVFPALPGLSADFKRAPMFKTQVKETVSGREFRGQLMLSPRYTYEASFEFLRDLRQGYDELRTLLGFFNARGGAFDDWLFLDPDDSVAAAMPFGTGDGATTQFQLVRTLGGFTEPVFDFAGTPVPFRNDWQGNQQLYPFARTNLLIRSAELDNAAWSKVAGGTGVVPVVTANYTAAPDGSITAERVQLDRGAGTTAADFSIMSAPAVTQNPAPGYSLSLWMKTNDASTKTVQVSISGGGVVNFTVTGRGSAWW